MTSALTLRPEASLPRRRTSYATQYVAPVSFSKYGFQKYRGPEMAPLGPAASVAMVKLLPFQAGLGVSFGESAYASSAVEVISCRVLVATLELCAEARGTAPARKSNAAAANAPAARIVTIAAIPFGDMQAKVETDFASGSGQYDTVVGPQFMMGDYLSHDWIIPVEEFLFAFVLTFSKAVPMSVVIAGTQDVMGVQFWYVSTRLLLAIVPPAIVVLVVQCSIVKGLTLGAVKG
jgi:hypothetical protein